MHLRGSIRNTCAVLALFSLLAGCGSDNNVPSPAVSVPSADTPITTPSSSPSGVTLTVQGANLPPSLPNMRVSAFDRSGAKVFGPQILLAGQTSVGGIPATALTVRLDAIGPSTPTTMSFVTALDATNGIAVVANPAFVDDADPVVGSFATVGCNRLQTAQKDVTPSTANSVQLQADFAELSGKVSPEPGQFFFTGDLVLAMVPGTSQLTSQLTAWKQLYATLPTSGIQLVAMPGNHEMLQQNQAGQEIPNPPSGAVWTTLMSEYLPGADGPVPGGPDGVQRDESRLSYTVRIGDVFYVVVNTDTWQGGETANDASHVPVQWVQSNVAAANADPAIRHIFVFGHKPVALTKRDAVGDVIAPTQALPFYQALSVPNTKVRAYLCAHYHAWLKGIPPIAPGGTLLQIVAGNGGSLGDGAFSGPTGYYGYTLVERTAGGRFVVESWGRPIPDPYSAQVAQPPSTLHERFTLYQPATAAIDAR